MFNPFIIAEIGVNHGGDINLAKRLIDDATEGGAHAVKFQVYKSDQLAIENSPAYWDINKEKTTTQKALFSKYDGLNRADYEELSAYCEIEFMVTPFCDDDIEWLNPLVNRWKIASADITNIPLLREVNKTGKQVILSTGAASIEDIDRALLELGEVSLLHCVLNYPTPYKNANLSRIKELKDRYPNLTIGYSDHINDMIQIDMAVFMGAEILEKHFTHDKTLQGNDHYHSMDKQDLIEFTQRLDKYSMMFKSAMNTEKDAIMYARRSIVAKCDIMNGDILTENNLTTKRPGTGISPIEWDSIIGRSASCDISNDTQLSKDMFE